ncbi:hypothetical protein B0H14DRAFT_2633915 [Mycena olivaceomarginata]|nr:hypothetical protein B0H14DRAFT_2633915 [Mycena olivaceomarginata]
MTLVNRIEVVVNPWPNAPNPWSQLTLAIPHASSFAPHPLTQGRNLTGFPPLENGGTIGDLDENSNAPAESPALNLPDLALTDSVVMPVDLANLDHIEHLHVDITSHSAQQPLTKQRDMGRPTSQTQCEVNGHPCEGIEVAPMGQSYLFSLPPPAAAITPLFSVFRPSSDIFAADCNVLRPNQPEILSGQPVPSPQLSKPDSRLTPPRRDAGIRFQTTCKLYVGGGLSSLTLCGRNSPNDTPRYLEDAPQINPSPLSSENVEASQAFYMRCVHEWTQVGSAAGMLFSVSYDPIVRTVIQLSIVSLFFGTIYAFILSVAFGKLDRGRQINWIRARNFHSFKYVPED